MIVQRREYFGSVEMSDVQTPPFKISATYVGCDGEVVFTADRAEQEGVVRACRRAVLDQAAVVRQREEEVVRVEGEITRSEERSDYHAALLGFLKK